MHFVDHRARESLWSLNSHDAFPVDRLDYFTLSIHTLECVRNRQAGRGTMSKSGLGNDAVYHSTRDERTSGVVDDDDLDIGRQVLESVPYRVSPLPPADRKKKPFGVALKQPRRRISDVIERKNHNDHRNVIARLKFLNAVKQHRLPCDPAELLQLISADSGTTSRRDDYNTDVSVH
jgi:hypothetical protein